MVNSIALKTKQFEIEVDIINDKISPPECQSKALTAWNDEFRILIKKVIEQEGFDESFIKEAKMMLQIRSRKGQNNIVLCEVLLKDENGKSYKNKKPIQDEAFEPPFEPFSIIDKRRYLSPSSKRRKLHRP